MAISNSTATTTITKYRLPDEHRQAILAQSDSALRAVQIEKQRAAFVLVYGDPFGTEKNKK